MGSSNIETRPISPAKAWAFLIGTGAAIIFVLSIIFGSWYTIDPTERGVVLTFNEISGIAGPGLHFKMPFVMDVERISMQTYTEPVDNLEAGSADQQPAKMRVSATFHANPEKVAEIYSRFQTLEAAVDRIIKPRVQSRVKVVFGQYTAARTFSERAALNDSALRDLQANMDDLFIIEGVQIEDVSFDKAYTDSISGRMVEEVKVAKKQQELAKERIEAQIANTQADAQAYRVKAQGNAEAQAIKVRGEAEAAAIMAKAKALTDSPNLVNLTIAQNWKGDIPQTLFSGGSSTPIPLLPLGAPLLSASK